MIDQAQISYVPTLSLRPAEMNGLRRLPAQTKSKIAVHLLLRPWVNARELSSALDTINATESPNVIINLDLGLDTSEQKGERPVFKSLRELKNPENGYHNWCQFIRDSEFMPTLLTQHLDQIESQTNQLSSIDRGLHIVIREDKLNNDLEALRIASETAPDTPIWVTVDCGQRGRGWELQHLFVKGIIDQVLKIAEPVTIIPSASTFPDSFSGLRGQSIYERGNFEQLRANCAGIKLKYGDRGSARAERSNSGGGAPIPRVDLALQTKWQFYRQRAAVEVNEETGEELDSSLEYRRAARIEAYQLAAWEALNSEHWNSLPEIWAKHAIASTATGGDEVTSPAASTSARINLHLHIQTNYGSPELIASTEEDWEDI